MAHPRIAIRAAVATALSNTSAGLNVFTNRVYSFKPDELPAIVIYCRDETSQPFDISRPKLRRNLSVLIDIIMQVSDEPLEDDLDGLCDEVESAINADDTFGGTVLSAVLTSTKLEINEQGEQPTGVAHLVYDVLYIG